VAVAVWVVMVMTEVVFLFTDSYKTYSEERSGYYRSPFDPEPDNYYHVYHCGDTLTVKAPEFSFLTRYNSLGFLGNEWREAKDSTRLRIITIGDSFTEGDGAPMDSCYPALMQKVLGENIEVLNAGVRGSDPVFGIKNFEDRLLNFQPDVVIQAVSENDVLFDMCIRGGYERFQRDSTVKFNSSPWWESIYAMSYVSRLFFHAFDYDMATPCGSIKNPAFIANQNLLLQEVFDRYEKIAATNNIKVLFMFYPTKFEVFRDAYDFDFSQAKKHLETLPHVSYVDLLPCYRSVIKSEGKKAADYYWIIDGHHNSTGYKMMAECIAEKVLELAENDTSISR
jgi:lysophospholipase L1-like esterase